MSSDAKPVPAQLVEHAFKRGQSGNPGGRPKGIDRQIREKHGDNAVKIVDVLVDLALGKKVEGYENVKPSDRVKAGETALDRIIGKPHQTLDADLHVGISDDQTALLAAIALTPEQRRQRIAELKAKAAASQAKPKSSEDSDGADD